MVQLIIKSGDIDYSSMSKAGEIGMRESKDGDLLIVVSGFEYVDKPSCRESTLRSMAWARDLLSAQIEVELLTNSSVFSVSGD